MYVFACKIIIHPHIHRIIGPISLLKYGSVSVVFQKRRYKEGQLGDIVDSMRRLPTQNDSKFAHTRFHDPAGYGGVRDGFDMLMGATLIPCLKFAPAVGLP